MTEIQLTGIKGILNRVTVFAHGMKEDVIDVSTRMDGIDPNKIVSNRVMLCMRTQKMIQTGQDMYPEEFLNNSSKNGGHISSKVEIDSLKTLYIPETNIVTNKIGKGYRAIGNTVMLIARVECQINTKQDLMPYQFIEMMLKNSGNTSKKVKNK